MPPLAQTLATQLAAAPALWSAVARAVADEDAGALGLILDGLGLAVGGDAIERLLDHPGPFTPFLLGLT